MPERFRYARLGREGDRLPWGNRLFGHGTDWPGFERVDLYDSQTQFLIRDGSIVLDDPPPPPPPVGDLPHVDP